MTVSNPTQVNATNVNVNATFFDANPGQFGYWCAEGLGTVANSKSGLLGGLQLTGSASSSTDATGCYLQLDTTTTAGNDVGLDINTVFTSRIQHNFDVLFKFALNQTDDIRFFAGMTSIASLATMLSSDTPSNNYVGVQFSTDRGDTTYQFVADNGSSQSAISNAAYTVDTSAGFIRVKTSATEANGVDISLYDSTFALKGALYSYVAASVPSATTALQPLIGLETRINSAKSMKFYSIYLQHKN